MHGTNSAFSNMTSIYAWNVHFKPGFSKTNFCYDFPTGAGKSIYADSYEIASSWQQGGISTW